MSTADELAKLHELLAKGALTQDEFDRAKARLLGGDGGAAGGTGGAAVNRLRRSTTDRWLGGVCGGIGAVSGIESWIWRLLFALGAFAGGAGVVLYLLMWIFVPPANE